ncbi:hypothetical protein MUY14_11005 [Amycolatopsis sp. FBCC-B4732]|uniref:hypothetical protein n=1 Tax=Amycolatopsis sp. FBCC-B4732 TaxID=3079339 RepID=UPI001FF125DA|nr:hypothetical protein [Amycolatopsis sp. FBCC-B4732]UOX91114.1 hypothetical protein MUY14_11005 [Amycolatopsis sp. FBCC-B4732]
MLLILAHAHDAAARALADRWGDEALLLTVDELHRAQWALSIDRSGRVRAELSLGSPVSVTGVVNRLGVLTGADLARVRREDRSYAAAELTAFLLAWLDACPAPVLNPPNPRCLNGPAWNPEEWADAAAAVGLRVAAVHRSVGFAPPVAAVPEGGHRVHVVGEVCIGEVHPTVGRQLRELASLAGAPLLTATVSGLGARAEVREISAWPDLADPAVADALAVALGRAASGGLVTEVGESPGHVPEAPAGYSPLAAVSRGPVGGGEAGAGASGRRGSSASVGVGESSGHVPEAAAGYSPLAAVLRGPVGGGELGAGALGRRGSSASVGVGESSGHVPGAPRGQAAAASPGQRGSSAPVGVGESLGHVPEVPRGQAAATSSGRRGSSAPVEVRQSPGHVPEAPGGYSPLAAVPQGPVGGGEAADPAVARGRAASGGAVAEPPDHVPEAPRGHAPAASPGRRSTSAPADSSGVKAVAG